MYRDGDEAPDQQTTWSEDQVRELALGILETPQGKALLAKALLEHLAEHEPIKERIGEIAIAAYVEGAWEVESENTSPKPPLFRSFGGVDCG